MFGDDRELAQPARVAAAPAVRLRIEVSYVGTGFHGFAPQPGLTTVGGVLADALAKVLRLDVRPSLTCAGRTDAGVHARGQVVHFDVPDTAPGFAALSDATVGDDVLVLQRRLVKLLAPQIVVLTVRRADDRFDARRSAIWRAYRYSVLNRPVPDPFLDGQVWVVGEPLDFRAMQLACDPLVGEHDFSSFCRRPPPLADSSAGTPEPASLVRWVHEARWVDCGDGRLRFDIRAGAFCHQMVRSIVGTLVEVGLGRRRAGEIAGILRARDRAAAGVLAPPEGLCLWAVGYPEA